MDLGESHHTAGGIERSCDEDEEEKIWQENHRDVGCGSVSSGGIIAEGGIGIFYYLRICRGQPCGEHGLPDGDP